MRIHQTMSFPTAIIIFISFLLHTNPLFQEKKKKNVHNIKRERFRQTISFNNQPFSFPFFLLHTNKLFQKRENSSNNKLSFNIKSFFFPFFIRTSCLKE